MKNLKKKSEINIKQLSEQILEYALKNCTVDMNINIGSIKNEFNVKRNFILEAFAFGSNELKKFQLIDRKPLIVADTTKPISLGKKGVVVVKKSYIEAYNLTNPDSAYTESDLFEVCISADEIVLKRIKY